MARGVTIDLIVDPKGAIKGLGEASDGASKSTAFFADLGKVGAAAIAAVATAAVAAAGALTAATVSAGKYADEILEASTNTNLSTETLQAYKYAAEQIDVSFETFVKSQGKFTKSMQDATAGTGPAAEGFAALGLSVTDSSGQLVDSETLYWQAIDALAGVTNETERTALSQQIFGKSGAEMNSIIAQGSAGFAALTEEARKNGAIMSGPQLEALGAFDDKMQALTSTVDAAKNALGLTLLPILDQLAGDGTSALGTFTTALLEADGDLSKAAPAFESLGTSIAGALTTAIPKILEVAASLVSGLISGIVSQAPSLIQTAIPLIVSFATGLLGMLPSILDAGIQILIALVQGVAAALPELIPAAVGAVIGLVQALVANLPMLLEAGLQLVIGLAKGLIDAIPQLVEQLPAIIVSIVGFIVGAIPMLIQAGIQLLLALVGALPEIITGIVKAIPQIITGVISAVVAAIPQLIAAGVQLLIALVTNLPTIIVEIIKAIPQIVTGIVGAFTDPAMIGQIASAGLELIRGLWEGIKGAGDWLWRQIKGFFGGVIDNIKALFGIRSPSKLMEDEIGAMLGLGLGRGFIDSLAAVKPRIMSAVSGLTDVAGSAFGGTIDVRARAAVATSFATDQAGRGMDQLAQAMRSMFPSQMTLVDSNGELLALMDVRLDARDRETASAIKGGLIR